MKICPNCLNPHNGEWSRCGYCKAVTEEPSKRRRQDSGTAGTDDAVAEHQHDQAEQATAGGWIE